MVKMASWDKFKGLVSKEEKKEEKKVSPIDVPDVTTESEVNVKKEELDQIIERLKRKKIKETDVSTEIANIRQTVENREVKRKLSFKTVSFDERMNSFIYSIGKLYQTMELPATMAAKWMYNFPMAKKLTKDLQSSGIKMTMEQYLVVASTISIIVSAMSLFIFATVGLSVNDMAVSALSIPMALFMFIFTAMMAITYPSRVSEGRGDLVSKELPFALRQMATQIKAGISLHKSMISVADSGYGALSEEFRAALDDMQRGASTEQALQNTANRTKSKGLKKTITHILRSMRTGGNLSEIISGIADDVSFEMRMKIRDFTEKLNLIGIVYVMVGIIAPVVVAIIASVLQIPMFGGGVPFEYIIVAYLGIIGVLIGIVWFTKKIEPKV